jgi:O-antigen ligase
MKGLLFTYLMTYGGAVAALFNPFAGLLVYVAFSIVSPPQMWYWEVPEGNYTRTVALALLAGWALKGFGNWRLGPARGVALALAGYWLWTLVTWHRAVDAQHANTHVELLTKIIIPVLVGISTIESVAQVRLLAWVIVLSQGYVAYELNLAYFGGFNQLREDGFAGMDNNSVAIALVTAAGLAFILGMEAKNWWLKGLALMLTGLMGHAILFSFSRGGVLALVVTVLTAFWLLPKKPRHYLMFLAVVLIGVRMAGPEVVARFATTFAGAEERDASAESRLVLWKACLDLLAKNPLLGIGPDQFGFYAPEYGFFRGKLAHTVWLTVAAESGLPGITCLLLFYGLCVKRLLPVARGRQAVSDPWLPVGARAVVTALLGFMVAAQFVSLTRLEIPYLVGLLGAGILKVTYLGELASKGGLPPAADDAPGAAGAYRWGHAT